MKKALFIGILSLMVATLQAQDEREFRTILDGKSLHISGFGGPMMQFTTVAGEFGHMMGGGGGVLINDFFFGGYGLGLTNQIKADASPTDPDDNLQLGHGGFWMGYSLFGTAPIHLSISALAGFGELSFQIPDTYQTRLNDQIFVLTPIVEVEANITQYLRIGAGATYSLYTGVQLPGYSASNFSTPGAFLSFKFGWF